MIREDLKARVIAWAEARNFFGEGGATLEGQLAKLLEEASELVTSIVRGRDATDDIGDCLVVLTILERMGWQVAWKRPQIPSSPVRSAYSFAMQITYAANFCHELNSGFVVKISEMLNINPNAALEHALAEIEPRRGSWSGGVFVKEVQ